MGKKSKTKASPLIRCIKCKMFIKTVGKGFTCPSCDRLLCEICARKQCCDNVEDCQSPPRCRDCASGIQHHKIRHENERRMEMGEPPDFEKEDRLIGYLLYPCGNCHGKVCDSCCSFKKRDGNKGHYFCEEKGCHKIRCYKCAVESGDPKNCIMYCYGCKRTKCNDCEPGMTMDSIAEEVYCGKCSSDKDVVSNKNGLILTNTMNGWEHKDSDRKVSEATKPPMQREVTAGMPKYQYYQNDNFMKVQILEPNVLPENLVVSFSPTELSVRIKKQEAKSLVEYAVIDGVLPHEVVVDKCKYIIKDEKVLIKLRKKEMVEWETLLDDRMGKDRQKSRAEEQSKKETGSPTTMDMCGTSVELDRNAPQASDSVDAFFGSGSAVDLAIRNAPHHSHRVLPKDPLHCIHVSPHPLSNSSTQVFVNTYFHELSKNTCSSSKYVFNEEVVEKVMITTKDRHPDILADDTKRKLIINFFVGLGAENLLHESEFEDARMSAAVISMLEGLIMMRHCQGNFLKFLDAIGGCTRSLFKFYIDRTPCSCLHEKYSQLKAERPKTGICDHCKERSNRSNLFACSKCNLVQYCSRKCQIAHWPRHRCLCDDN